MALRHFREQAGRNGFRMAPAAREEKSSTLDREDQFQGSNMTGLAVSVDDIDYLAPEQCSKDVSEMLGGR